MRNIALASDDNFAIPLKVAIYSYLKSNPEPTRVHVLFESLSEEHLDSLRMIASQISPDSEIVAHKVDSEKFEQRNDCSVTSTATCVRYLIPEIIQDCDTVLYLDSDLVVVGDLGELFTLDISDSLIAGVRDRYVSTTPWGAELQRRFGVGDYVNAGVLLMNLRNMREEETTSRFLELDVKNKFPYRDQDVINVTCSGRVLCVDQKYNDFIFDGDASSCILHFAGKYKPWYAKPNKFQAVWWKNFDEMAELLGNKVSLLMQMPVPNLFDADDRIRTSFDRFIDGLGDVEEAMTQRWSLIKMLLGIFVSQDKNSIILSSYIGCFIRLISQGEFERRVFFGAYSFYRFLWRIKRKLKH